MTTARIFALPALVALVALTSGCAAMFADNTTTAGARPFSFDYQTVDLVTLLAPGSKVPTTGADGTTQTDGQRIDLAFRQFHLDWDDKSNERQVAARNQIQERLLGASNQLCHR